MQLFSIAMTVFSVYSMLKAGDELGGVLNGDYSEKEKAEKFGKAAAMMILSAAGLYGSLNVVLQPGMLRSIVTKSESAIGKTFADIKSLVRFFTIHDADSMLLSCEEFVSGPALQTLREAVKGCNVKQLHDMAKMIREAKNTVGRILKEDELVVAVNNWRENGSITKAVQAVVDWVKLGMGEFVPKSKSDLWGKEEYVTEKNLNIIKKHLSGDLSADFNDAMISRLDAAYKNDIKINGADLDFYKHELYESKMMRKGFSYNDAHDAAKEYYNAKEFNLYHPEVIKNAPQFFNGAWFEFWNIERN